MTVDVVGTGARTSATPSYATVLPGLLPKPKDPGERRKLTGLRETDVFALVGALASSLGLTWLSFTQFAPFTGGVGWVVFAYVMFVAVYAVLVSLDESSQAVKDRLVAVVVHSLAALLIITLVFVLGFVLFKAFPALIHLNFYVQDLQTTGPLEPLTSGGVLHAMVGTLEQITISLIITIPLGLTGAVYLNEFRGPVPRFVRTIVEAMTALPSIVAGLFIFTTWILTFGFDKSGFAAALALSIMMLPIIIRAADVVLRLVPGNLKEASLALGAGQWRTIWHVTLPTARSGLATAIILGTARGIGETSPVLLTAGFANAINANALSGPQVSLPLLAFSLYNSPSNQMRDRAFGAAAVLLVMVLGLFVAARTIGGRGPGNLTKRQAAKRAEQSFADARRFVARAGGDLPPLTPWFPQPGGAGDGGGAAAGSAPADPDGGLVPHLDHSATVVHRPVVAAPVAPAPVDPDATVVPPTVSARGTGFAPEGPLADPVQIVDITDEALGDTTDVPLDVPLEATVDVPLDELPDLTRPLVLPQQHVPAPTESDPAGQEANDQQHTEEPGEAQP